jgi:parallel beta-helix repeat protein
MLQILPQQVESTPQVEFKAAAPYPIYINHNDNFSIYASSGTGSSGSPWIIQNYVITNGTVDTGIYIKDTTDHFIITGCTLTITLPSTSRGIYLSNVENAQIIGNSISGSNWGIYAVTTRDSLLKQNTFTGIAEAYFKSTTMSTNNVTITGHTFTGCTVSVLEAVGSNYTISHNCFTGNFNGLYVSGAENDIVYNTIIYSSGTGMALDLDDSNVSHNIVHWNSYALTMDGCMDNKFINNSVQYNGHAPRLINSDHNTLYNNIFSHNNHSDMYGQGIRFEHSHNNTLTNNFLEDNALEGIYLEYSDDNTIIHNIIKRNGANAGITLLESSSNDFYNNTLNNPTDYGIELKQNSDSNNITANVIQGWSTSCIEIASGCDGTIDEGNTCSAGGGGIPGFLFGFVILSLAMVTAILLSRKQRNL